MLLASAVFRQAMKWDILENLPTTTKMESTPLCVRGSREQNPSKDLARYLPELVTAYKARYSANAPLRFDRCNTFGPN